MIRFLLPAVVLVVVCSPARAQEFDGSDSDLALLSINALIGGASAGVVAFVRGEDVTDAFTAGVLGGGVSFAGKRVAAADFTASAFVGRQLAAIGHGIVVDAGRGDPLLSEIWLPVGPLQLRVPSPREKGVSRWGARLDLTSTAAIVYAATQAELEMDWRSSAEAGTPVFRARGRVGIHGDSVDGAAPLRLILLGADAGQGVLRHEAVHVIQQDFVAMAWSYPAEEAIRGLLGADQPWLDHFPLGVAMPALGQLLNEVTGEESFVIEMMEHEAYSLVQRERPYPGVWRSGASASSFRRDRATTSRRISRRNDHSRRSGHRPRGRVR